MMKSVIQEDLSEGDLARLKASQVVAVDAEMTGLNPHRDLLCLVQLCDCNGNVTFVRAANWSDALRLCELLQTCTVMKLFHYAVVDCGFILRHLGVEVANAYCTKIASKIARTYSPKHSLSALVREFMGIELDKSQQSTNWQNSELTPDQLEYAANDVIWLIELRQELENLLRSKGTLPSGISYQDLNARCQAFIPTMVHLWLNGWHVSTEGDRLGVFAY